MPKLRWLLLATVAAALLGGRAVATVYEIGPDDDLQDAVDALAPGDELVLRGGTYLLTSRLSIELLASAAQPIAIRAKAGEVPVVTYVDDSQNVINVEHSAHLTLRGLEVTGGSHGIRIDDSDFVTVEDCHIHHTGDVALSANVDGSEYEGLRLVHNHIHDTGGSGEGMYLGCNFDACRMFDSLVANNYIHDTDGPGVSQGDGIEIKEGSYGNLVVDNVIHDTNYPCILTYSTVGNGGPNIIERNALWSCGDHAIQAAADAVIRNNIILGAAQDGIRSQIHQNGVPGNLVITHNTVLAPANDALRVSDVSGPVVIANNALYAQSGAAIRVSGDLGQVTATGNAGEGSLVGLTGGFDGSGNLATDFLAASYSGGLPQDVFPAPGSLLVASADPAWLASDDFNGWERNGALDAGAYRYDPGGNPGWTLSEGFKVLSSIFADGFESGGTGAWTLTVP